MKWTIKTLLLRASEILKERGVTQTPRLDAELLLSYSLGFSDRVKLYTEFDRPLTEDEVEKYRKLIVRRVKGEPVAYITGKKEFYGYTFRVERGVLIPRPETELLVDVVLEYLRGKEGKTIVDVGTGSGCIIITLCKLLGKIHRYVGTDIPSIALKVAEKNRRIHGCREVEFVKTDLLKGVKPPISVVVSNPPTCR
jgi:release factor glutamine methyltransferase